MQNIIAVIWDFDKTLVDGYMQDPIFNEYGVDAHDFWVEVNALPEKYQIEGVKVNKDTIYLIRNEAAFKQVEKLREDGRIDMFAEADYSNGTTASMWICNKIKEFAERIKIEEKNKRGYINSSPKHLV